VRSSAARRLHAGLRDSRPTRVGRNEDVAGPPPPNTAGTAPERDAEERIRRAYDDGRAAALRGDEAAPGCTTTPEGKAFLAGYVAGARSRQDSA
jgi:hypothetical protein